MNAKRSRMAAVAVLGLLMTATVGCAVNPATGERAFTGGMSTQEEVATGRKQHPKILAEMGGAYDNPPLARYVDSIGQLLARTTERRSIKYTFTVINSDIVNAFAIPGGYIYISRGLLALADDEAELAGVLAHELGHITALHHARRHGQSMLANIGLMAAGILAGAVAPGTEREILGLGQQATTGVLRSFSRDNEYQADDLGIRYLSRAGYDPQAMARFLAKLRAHSRLEAVLAGRSADSIDKFNYLATHPAPQARVTRASANAGKASVKRPITAQDIYFGKIDGIIYGEDPEQGFVRSRDFIHPKLLFRFSVPDGFRLRNAPKTVTAQGPGGSLIVFDMARNAGRRGMSDYLARVWTKGRRLSLLRNIAVNGLKGAEGFTRIRTKRGPIDLRLVAVRGGPDRIYRFMFLSPPRQTAGLQRGFDGILNSLRRIGSDEAASIKPLRLRIVRIGPGETQRAIARRMALPERRLERFQVLNGLGPRDRLGPGRRVKIVTE